MVQVRLATEEDLPAIITGCLQLYEQTPWKVQSIPVVEQLSRLRHLLMSNSSHVLYVAEDDGMIVGILGANIVEHPLHLLYPTCHEWCFWVHPRYRYQKVGWTLLQALAGWCRQRGIKSILYAKSTRPAKGRGPVEQLYCYQV